MADGIGGLDFVNNMMAYLAQKWTEDTGGEQPVFTSQWKKKETGFVDGNYQEVILSLDSENPNIYSLLQSTDGGGFFWDWLHDISITIDVRTGDSEGRVLQMVNEIVRILKTTVILPVNDTVYVQVLPESIVSLNEEYRNLFRYTVDVTALQFNPT